MKRLKRSIHQSGKLLSTSDSLTLTDEGVVEGVWIFSRHGDRTPVRPLCPKHRRNEEAAYWVQKLPVPDTASVFRNYAKKYPVQRSGAYSDTFMEERRNPFGFLTSKGLYQLAENGRYLFQRYNRLGHHVPGCDKWENARDFMDAWDVKAFSTNYLRTIMSAQSLLDGIFGTRCHDHTLMDRPLDPSTIREESIPSPCADLLEGDEIVPITVRNLKQDPLNAFERNPDLIEQCTNDVMTSEEFLLNDGKAATLAARLANYLPGLVKKRTSTDFSTRSPSGINWVEAADHFVARNSHGLELSAFSEYEHDVRVERTLEAMAFPTLLHLSWRYRCWYQHDGLLSLMAAPPLREIADQVSRVPSLGPSDARPFVVYSCHDITLLGILYGIGADFLTKETTGLETKEDMSYWPPYGSHLVFELVRMKDKVKGDYHVVRIILNGSLVRSVNAGSHDNSLLSISELEDVVTALEESGGAYGYNFEKLLGKV